MFILVIKNFRTSIEQGKHFYLRKPCCRALSSDSRLLDESVGPLFDALLAHTRASGNLATLVRVFVARVTQLHSTAGEAAKER